ncbi:MAG: hypothetical protein HY092_02250 [Candidatus Kerfeldbacteria bacterium]|nr:hypothetical protein [Candidatus Kerfeldbacteria bacterium]
MEWLLAHVRNLREAHQRTFGSDQKSLETAEAAICGGHYPCCRKIVDELYSVYACADAEDLRLAAFDILTHLPRAA